MFSIAKPQRRVHTKDDKYTFLIELPITIHPTLTDLQIITRVEAIVVLVIVIVLHVTEL